MKENDNWSGIFTALVTPFKGGQIDWVSLKRLIRQQVLGGVQGVVVSGTTGESPTLSSDEKRDLFAFVKNECKGAVKVIMGTGSNSTSDTIAATIDAAEWGADAALVVVPYYNKPSQAGLVAHFELVARSVEGRLPIILYNVPSRTITALSLESIEKLSQNRNVAAIKEASGDIDFGAAIKRSTGLALLSGGDGSFLDLVAVGSCGVISVISNLIPAELRQLWLRAENGDLTARGDFRKQFGLLNAALYREANPIPVKYAMAKLGLIDESNLRLPLTPLDPVYHAEIDNALKVGGLL